MTLVQSVGVGQLFTIMTTDTRMVRSNVELDHETGTFSQDKDSSVIVSEKSLKVNYLTNFVMVGRAGMVDLTEYIIKKLFQKVSPMDDLTKCKNALNEVIQEIKSDKDNELHYWLISPGGGSIILNGFYENGGIGQVIYNEKEGGFKELNVPLDEPDMWFTGCLPPTNELGKRNILQDHINQNGKLDIESVLKSACTVHGFIAYFHDISVSTDLHYCCLIKNDNIIVPMSGKYDSVELFPEIERRKSKIKEIVT